MNDPVYAAREAYRVQHALNSRKEFRSYNFNSTTEQVVHRGTTAPVIVPALGCLVHSNNSGYGDCSERNYIVVKVERTDKTRTPCTVWLREVHGLDVGIGDADAMPERPGCVGIDDATMTQALPLTLNWWKCEDGQWKAEWKHRTQWKTWGNEFYTFGVYSASQAGIDK